MASNIKIKRSATAGAPAVLGAGELAYSSLIGTASNGGDRLYIGTGTETGGNAVNHEVIGGKYFTDMITAATDANTASTLVKRDASGNFIAGTITAALTGNASTANKWATARNLTLSGDADASFVAFDGSANGAATITFAASGVTAGTYGSATTIPVLVVDAKGRITSATTSSITVGNGALTLGIGSAAATANSITIGTGTGFTANTGSVITYDIKVGPALTNLATFMTTATAGFIKRTAQDTYNIDTNTYLTAEADTLFTVTNRGAITSIKSTFSGGLIVNTIEATGTNASITLTPTGTGTVDVASKRITSVATPSASTDAANKAYVDAVKTGLNVKDAAKVATTATLTVTYSNGTSGVNATLTNANTQAVLVIDGITLAVDDRVLVKDQAAALQNGIYTVTNIGSVSTNWVLTRATDFDNNPAGEIAGGDFVFVQEGTAQADNGYVVTSNGTITVGTSTIDFVQFSGAGQITAGAGLTKTGNTLNVGGTADRVTVNADSIDIASTYVGQTSITTLGTITTGTIDGGTYV